MAKWKFDQFGLLAAVERRRAHEGISKRELAKKLDLSQTSLSEMSTKLRAPGLPTLLTLLEWLGDDIWDYAERVE